MLCSGFLQASRELAPGQVYTGNTLTLKISKVINQARWFFLPSFCLFIYFFEWMNVLGSSWELEPAQGWRKDRVLAEGDLQQHGGCFSGGNGWDCSLAHGLSESAYGQWKCR